MQYRVLEIGEIIQRGDLYWDDRWRKHAEFHFGTAVDSGHYPIKRPIVNDPTKISVPKELSEGKITLNGHEIVQRGDNWFYKDNGQQTKTRKERPCGFCNMASSDNEPDACLGVLPGVMNACCGHGNIKEAYIQFENGMRVSGFNVTKG